VRIVITLVNGETHDLLDVDNADEWVKRFALRGTAQLGDWVEVAPEDEAAGRRFVRASQIITVELIDDEGEYDEAGEASQQ
jgi:hypothetical protein